MQSSTSRGKKRRSSTSRGKKRRPDDDDDDDGQDPRPKRGRHKNTKQPLVDAVTAIKDKNLDGVKDVLKYYGTSNRFKIAIFNLLQAGSNSASQEFASTVLKLLLDPTNPEKNMWLADVSSNRIGENAFLMAAHYAAPDAMRCIIAMKATDIHSVNTHNQEGVVWTALQYNKNLSTIRYLIGVLYASNRHNIILTMYNALVGEKIIQDQKVAEFLQLLEPYPKRQETVDRLFQLSVMFGQFMILACLFKLRFPTDMHKLLCVVCELDDIATTKTIVDMLDDEHSAMLVEIALEENTVETLPIIISNYLSKNIQYSDRIERKINGFLELALEHNNIIAWRLLVEKWPKKWGPLSQAVDSSLYASSSEYIKALHEQEHLALLYESNDNDYKNYLEQAVRRGFYEVVIWIIETLHPVVDYDDLMSFALPDNGNDPLGLIVLYLNATYSVYSLQKLFDCLIDEKRWNVAEFVYMKNPDINCTQHNQDPLPLPFENQTQRKRRGVFLDILSRSREQKQHNMKPLARISGDEGNVQTVWNHMVTFDTVTRDVLQQTLPMALLTLVGDYGQSVCDAVHSVSLE
jgi:hypothetical protein